MPGSKGDRGFAGSKGNTGDLGPQGLQGPVGMRGFPGKQGLNFFQQILENFNNNITCMTFFVSCLLIAIRKTCSRNTKELRTRILICILDNFFAQMQTRCILYIDSILC